VPLREKGRAGVAEGGRNSTRTPRGNACARAASTYGLTPAQQAIVRYLMEGRSLKQIGHLRRRHRRTIADHVRELKRKTGSRTLVEMISRLCTAPGRKGSARVDLDNRVCEFARRHKLTVTQAAVLKLLLGGKTIAGIARSLDRHPTTVKRHIEIVRRSAGGCTCIEVAVATLQQTGRAR